jgi:hypothetical protein
MKKAIIFISLCLTIKGSKAQSLLTKDSLDFVFKETLAKSRNAVSNATNNWRYDNSNDDYYKQDTIILNTARSYKMNYCNGINWSFYKEKRFILEFTQTCNEPPTKLRSKKEHYMRLQIIQRSNKFYLRLLNKNGLSDEFEILTLKRNTPLSDGESAFDYTIVLLRHK